MISAIKVRTSELVSASSARPNDGPFRCPNPSCKARVGLRKGTSRVPHFAHLSHEAKPDCYAYSGPQTSSSVQQGARIASVDGSAPRIRSRVAVGFTGDTSRTFALVLEVPRASPNDWWEGRILLATSRGEIRISHAQLKTENQIYVGPADTYEFRKETPGNVSADYWALVSGPIEALHPAELTFFRDSIQIGAKLPPGAPLIWGEGYWVITKENCAERLSLVRGIDVLAVDNWEAGWWVHRFQVQEYSKENEDDIRASVRQHLNRVMAPPRPRAFVISPSPHHISIDGSWFLPLPIKELVIRTTSQSSPTVTRSDGRNITTSLDENNDLVIKYPQKGKFSVLCGDSVLLTVEIGDAAFMAAPGLQVDFNAKSVDLLELQTAIASSKALENTAFRFKLPHDEVRSLILVGGKPWAASGDNLMVRLLSAGGMIFDVGPYGWIDTRDRPSVEKHFETSDLEALRPISRWLLSSALPAGEREGETLSDVLWDKCPSWLQLLKSRFWTPRMAAQVRSLHNQLKSKGLA